MTEAHIEKNVKKPAVIVRGKVDVRLGGVGRQKSYGFLLTSAPLFPGPRFSAVIDRSVSAMRRAYSSL